MDAGSGKVVQTFGEPSTLHHRACWSPDGTKFLVTSALTSRWSLSCPATPLATLPISGWGPAWSPDSKSVYLLSPAGTLLWDVAANSIVRNIGSSWNELVWRQPDRLVKHEPDDVGLLGAAYREATGRVSHWRFRAAVVDLWASDRDRTGNAKALGLERHDGRADVHVPRAHRRDHGRGLVARR